MNDFLHSNIWYWRLARTAVEVVLAFVVANGANILTGYGMDAATVTAIMGVVAAVLSPIIASLKKADESDGE